MKSYNYMQIVNLSLDKRILEKDSAVQRRLLALAEKVGNITVFVPAKRSSVETLSPHLTVYGFGGPKIIQLWKMWRKARSLIFNLSSLTHPTSVLPSKEGRRFDLITVQDAYFLGWLGIRLGEKFSVPVEIQVHGLEKFFGLRKRTAEYILQKADKVRVVSNRLKECLTNTYKLKANSLYVLPVYTHIDIPQRQMKRKTVPYPFTFLTVGRLVSVKNIGLQIQAMSVLSKQVPHIRLVIVGDGPERESLKSQGESLKLEEKILFEGEQRDVSKYYEEADAFLLTSDSEGWGLAVLEAAAHKLPVIMTDVGLAREVIKNEESGLIIPVGDEQELVCAMQELLDKPELRVKLGEAAFKAFKGLPTKEEHIQRQVEVWEALVVRK